MDLLKFLVEVIEEVQEALHNEALLAVLDLGYSLHFCLEDLVVPLEDRVLIRQLLRDIRLAFEDGLQVLPLGLHGNKDLQGLGDLGDSALPVINVGVEFFVERRALGGSESLAVVLNELHDVLSRLDEEF